MPVGLAANIGPTSYMKLTHVNNAYLALIASIPEHGVNGSTLNYSIFQLILIWARKKWAPSDILMDTDWCVQSEPTQNPRRILLLITKIKFEGYKWLNDNLPTICMKYLPKNPCYQPKSENAIPYKSDVCQVNATLDNYADTLKKHIHVESTTGTTTQQFAHLPASHAPHLITISYSAAAQNDKFQTEMTKCKQQACTGKTIQTMDGWSCNNGNDSDGKENNRITPENLQKTFRRELVDNSFTVLHSSESIPHSIPGSGIHSQLLVTL